MSNYSEYDIKQLWQMVDSARRGLQPSHDQVAALSKAQEMLGGHAQSLEEARDQLAAQWPPETSAASAAYLSELDRLIAAVRDTALSCAVNVFHINAVIDAIVQTHDTVAPLHTEYVQNEVAFAQYDAEIKAFGDGASAAPGGSTIARGAARLFTSPPAEDRRQDDLTRQVQQAMVQLAGAAQDGAAHIKPPAPYMPPTVGQPIDDNPTEYTATSESGSSSGAIPPPTIASPASTRQQTNNAAAPIVDGGGAQPSTGGSGPGLSGYSPAQIQPAPGPHPPTETTSPIALGGQIGPLAGPIPGQGAATGRRLPIGLAPGEGSNGRGLFGSNGAVRGGVIGNISGGTEPVPPTPSRVNATPGVIGQQPVSDGKGGARGVGNRMVGGNGAALVSPQAGRRKHGSAAIDEERWDPDNPWQVEQGVDPVIMPTSAPRCIDPGPGIIGIDR